MTVPINKLRGISDELKAKLKEQGLGHSGRILEATRDTASRKALAGQMGVEPQTMLELANRADLARVRGIGGVYSDLLENAGVDTIKELATRRPDNLHAKLLEINTQMKLTKRPPTLKAVEDWVAQAKELPRAIEY